MWGIIEKIRNGEAIIGHVHVDKESGAVETHRDSYLLKTLTVVSVRRPALPAGILFGGGFVGFCLAFGDLMWPHEIALTLTGSVLALVAGWQVGQLKLLSRDLRGSELAGVIWGRYADLNAVRGRIVRAIAAGRAEDA